MPLMHGKSKKAFEHNLKTEMHEGKPMKQSLAIAYSLARKKKKMAEGGDVPPMRTDKPMKSHVGVHGQSEVDAGGVSHAGGGMRRGFDVKDVHEQKLKELKEMPKPKLKGLADGGYVEEENMSGYVDHPGDPEDMHEEHDEDMIDRIMAKRQACSEGGMIANGGEDDLESLADSRPNNFDDLALRDDLESSYTEDNSGDELGDAQEDHDREDIVARVMASRKKKDRLPNPR